MEFEADIVEASWKKGGGGIENVNINIILS